MSRLAVTAAMLWLLATSARAALTFSLQLATPVAAPGAELLFAGTLVNTSATDKLFLNDIVAGLTSGTTLRANTFFANVPGILLPGESYTGPLFKVKLAAGAAATDYSGSITIQGGATIEAATSLASAAITLLATPASQWRYQTFGTEANEALAADVADWDSDGAENLLEYALGTNARNAGSKAQIPSTIVASHLTLSYTPVPGATDVTYLVESSTDLIHWGTANVELITPGQPGIVSYRYGPAVSLVNAAFMRLSVSR